MGFNFRIETINHSIQLTMLSQIVRPLVQTQVRLLANSQATQTTLVETIARWLGYIGVSAKVTELVSDSGRIHVSLTVGKPDSCDNQDWQRIVDNLHSNHQINGSSQKDYHTINESQQIQLARLLAYLIQIGDPDGEVNWHDLEVQLTSLNLDQSILVAVKSALKVPQSEDLLNKLDPDVAASIFPIAVKIAWLDQEINPYENQALSALLGAMK